MIDQSFMWNIAKQNESTSQSSKLTRLFDVRTMDNTFNELHYIARLSFTGIILSVV